MKNKLLATLAVLTIIATFMFSANAVSAKSDYNEAIAESNGSDGEVFALADYNCLADASAYGAGGFVLHDSDTDGNQDSSVIAAATADDDSHAKAEAYSDTYGSEGSSSVQSQAVATGGGNSIAYANLDAGDSAGDASLYAAAVSSGDDSGSFSEIRIKGDVAPGFYYAVDSEGGAFAIAFMVSNGDTVVAYTYASAQDALDAMATINSGEFVVILAQVGSGLLGD